MALDKRLGDPLEAVKVLVELGADVNATNMSGQTAMHNAAFLGEDEIIQFLADNGAEVDVEDEFGQTPWTMARGIIPSEVTLFVVSRGRYGIYESTADLLLELGATPRSIEDKGTRTIAPDKVR